VSTIVYARVSTAEQDLDHQRERLFEHAVEELGVDAEEIDVIEDRSTGDRRRPRWLPRADGARR
jgi:DNA invertase Pin-like site-specific DNA recombinase